MEVDITYYLLKLLSWCGIWDLVVPVSVRVPRAASAARAEAGAARWRPKSPKVALAGFRRILGADAVLTDRDAIAPCLTDHRKLYEGTALAVLRPGSVDEVSQLLAFCNGTRIGVVPQGGNTGYCGGATPDGSGRQVVLSLARLARLRSIDATNHSMIAEAVASSRTCSAKPKRRSYFPLSLSRRPAGRRQSSTNAGGLNVLRYGMARDPRSASKSCRGRSRAVARRPAQGQHRLRPQVAVHRRRRHARRDHRGVPQALSAAAGGRHRVRGVRSVAAAVDLLNLLREASGDRLSSFELIPHVAIELTTRHIPGVAQPSRASIRCVLCELGSARAADPLDSMLENALRDAMDGGLLDDAALAQNERQRAAFWRLRESIPEAQRHEGASLKHDIALPIASLARFVDEASAWIASNLPEAMLVAYGHVGDGNLHFNVNARAGTDPLRLVARADEVQRVVHDLVASLGGSISAEHGIGRLKVPELERYAPPAKLDLMRAIKHALDPNGIMNPGKVLRSA